MKATIQLSPMIVQPSGDGPPHLFTEAEMADYLRVSRRQLYSWRMSGLIPYIKLGKAVRYRLADVESVLSTLTIQHESKP